MIARLQEHYQMLLQRHLLVNPQCLRRTLPSFSIVCTKFSHGSCRLNLRNYDTFRHFCLRLPPMHSYNEKHSHLDYYAEEDFIPIAEDISLDEDAFEESPFKRIVYLGTPDEEEDPSLIPEEWRDIQSEINVPKKERKYRIHQMEIQLAHKKKHELQLRRDGLSQSNIIKLPAINFPTSQSEITTKEYHQKSEENHQHFEENHQLYEEKRRFPQENRRLSKENSQLSYEKDDIIYRYGKSEQALDYDENVVSGGTSDHVDRECGDNEASGSESFDMVVNNDEDDVNRRVSPNRPRIELIGDARKFKDDYKEPSSTGIGKSKQETKPRQVFTWAERTLLNKRTPNLPKATSGKWIPLHTFATADQPYLLDYLLTFNVDINAADEDGKTALHKAVSCKNKSMVYYLLHAGADALVQDNDGATLMHYAVEIGASQLIKQLLWFKVDINQPDNCGWTPLHLAVFSKRTDIVRLLLEKDADKNLRNKDEYTPLELCLYFWRDPRTYEIIRLLKTLPKDRVINHDGVPISIN